MHVVTLLTLKAYWFGTLTVKQLEIMINNDVLLFSATNEEIPYEQLLHLLFSLILKIRQLRRKKQELFSLKKESFKPKDNSQFINIVPLI